MLWVIRELKRRPAQYGLSFFAVLTAYLAGGMTALRLDAATGARVIGGFFAGTAYWSTVGHIALRRFLWMAAQGVCGIWMATQPLSVACGMMVQISLSLPWWCMAGNAARGVFLGMLLLLPSTVFLIAGSVCMGIGFGYFRVLFSERRLRKSAWEKLSAGLLPMRVMLAADAAMLLVTPIEVYLYFVL